MRQGKGRYGLTSVYQHAIVFRRGQNPEKTDPTRTLEKTSFSGDWTGPTSFGCCRRRGCHQSMRV